MKIKYSIGVKVDAGWRQVYVTAECKPVSPKMTKITRVITIDGQIPHYGQSRTGARRQSFNGRFWANCEMGKMKRISACQVLE